MCAPERQHAAAYAYLHADQPNHDENRSHCVDRRDDKLLTASFPEKTVKKKNSTVRPSRIQEPDKQSMLPSQRFPWAVPLPAPGRHGEEEPGTTAVQAEGRIMQAKYHKT